MSSNSVYVIAEAGVNHNGDRGLAFDLIDVAADAGADSVKFQTFNAKKLASRHAPKAIYQKDHTDHAQSQQAMLEALELPLAWHRELKAHAIRRGIEFLSTPFDLDSLNFLDTLDLPLYKVPSGEITNLPLLWQFARRRKPLVVSTGMATLSEVEQALAVVTHGFSFDCEPGDLGEVWRAWSEPAVRARLSGRVTLLHCTSQYPTPFEQVDLRAMDTLAGAFGLPVGYSDHTQGCLVPVLAVARGAVVIEKHFTTSRALPGPDHAASLEPDELVRMVSEIRSVGSILGNAHKAPQPAEWDSRRSGYQQVIAARDIAPGSVIARDDLTTARCGRGRPAAELWSLVGTVSMQRQVAGEPFEVETES